MFPLCDVSGKRFCRLHGIYFSQNFCNSYKSHKDIPFTSYATLMFRISEPLLDGYTIALGFWNGIEKVIWFSSLGIYSNVTFPTRISQCARTINSFSLEKRSKSLRRLHIFQNFSQTCVNVFISF